MKIRLKDSARLRYYAPLILCLILIVILLVIPTGFEGALQYQEADRCIARVLSVDDSAIIDTGARALRGTALRTRVPERTVPRPARPTA